MSYEAKKQKLDKELENTSDLFERMEIQDQLFNLKIEYGFASKNSSGEIVECVGCGS